MVFDPDVFDPDVFDPDRPFIPVDTGPPPGGPIEAWVTDPAGNYIATLDRSDASPFRRFAVSAAMNEPGVGSFEYHLDNEIVASFDDLFAYGMLVWMRYRGKTRVWVIEDRKIVLDESEHQTDWVQVSGRGAMQLIGDRTIWPTHYSDTDTDPTQWGLGGWKTKTDASAALGQRVVPVVSTTVGLGATVGDPVEIVGGGNRQIGIIESIVAGVSITLEDDLAYTFPKGSRVRSAASQWRRFVNRRAGFMLWDIISESNGRRAWAQIARGTVETTGADGWTQDFRFDNQLEVLQAVTDVYGDVEMDGLTYNYYNAMGVDRTESVVIQEGADLVRLDVADSDRDSLSWVVAEGTGHAVFSFLAPKKKLKRSTRKTAHRKRTTKRKAPPAPRKVILVKADYAIDLASEELDVLRPREAFLDAKDVSDLAQLDALADAALEEHQVNEAVGIEIAETNYQVDVDYGLGDWITAIAPSRGFDEEVRIVSIGFAEDDNERVRVSLDVNTRRVDGMIRLAKGAKDTRSSLGVQNRQPQGNLTFSAIADTVYFDSTTDSVTGIYVSDRIQRTIECRLAIDFDSYPMPVSAAASGGGSTSGSSSASSSSSDLTGLGFVMFPSAHSHGGGASASIPFADDVCAEVNGTGDHSHSIPHTHSTPNHTHSLTAAKTMEAYPGSHSVSVKVYELEDTTWTLRGTISGLVDDVEDLDLTPYIIGPGRWRIVLQSAGGQPNGGRLGAHLSGFLVGSIQAE